MMGEAVIQRLLCDLGRRCVPWTYPTWEVLAGLGKKQRECLPGWGAQSLPAVPVYMDQSRGEGLLIAGQYTQVFSDVQGRKGE